MSKTLVTDAVPPARQTWRAARRFDGGDPGDALAWRLTKAEAEQVRQTAISPLADSEAGVVGIGKCIDVATNRPCEFHAACLRTAIRQEPMTCRVRIDADAERAELEARQLAMRNLSERILVVIQASAEPITFMEIVAKLGIGTQQDGQARGAFHSLILEHPPRIESVGTRRSYCGRNSRKVKLWIAIAREQDHAVS